RVRYLAEIVENNRKHNTWVMEQAALAERCYVLAAAKDALPESAGAARTALQEQHDLAKQQLAPECRAALDNWDQACSNLAAEHSVFHVRKREVKIENYTVSLSGIKVPKVAMPRYQSHGDRLRWL